MERPFLRDVIFYIGAAYWTFYIFHKGVVTTWEAIGKFINGKWENLKMYVLKAGN